MEEYSISKDQQIEKECGLVELHNDLIDILSEFDRIAKLHNIQYSTAYGTMLGQIRHKGFIPWDDDADIFITRDNYERLIGVWQKESKAPFRLITAFSYQGKFVDLIPKIILEKNAYEAKDEFSDTLFMQYPRVDLFVLDKAPKNKLLFKLFTFRLKIIYALCASHGSHQFKDIKIPLIQRLGFRFFRFFGKLFNLNSLLNHYYKICKKYQHKKKYSYCDTGSMLDLKFIFNPTNFQHIDIKEFSKIHLPCFVDYEVILKQLYGENYLTPIIDNSKYISHFKINGFNQDSLNKYY